eukprot:COSAG03_NODE_1364_length_4251_cov_4.775771_3_plen_70_part_00
MEVVGVEGSRVLFERYLPLHDTVFKKRYRVALRHGGNEATGLIAAPERLRSHVDGVHRESNRRRDPKSP